MLNGRQNAALESALIWNEKFLKVFYNEKNNNEYVLAEIYKSILDPEYKIEGRDEPLAFSSFDKISWIIKNQDNILPLSTARTPRIHQSAYSIWAIATGDIKEIKGFNLIQYAEDVSKLPRKGDTQELDKEAYNVSLVGAIKSFARGWIENRVKTLEQDKAELLSDKVLNSPADSVSASTSSTTQPDTPESPPIKPTIFVDMLIKKQQEEEAKFSSASQRSQ